MEAQLNSRVGPAALAYFRAVSDIYFRCIYSAAHGLRLSLAVFTHLLIR